MSIINGITNNLQQLTEKINFLFSLLKPYQNVDAINGIGLEIDD